MRHYLLPLGLAALIITPSFVKAQIAPEGDIAHSTRSVRPITSDALPSERMLTLQRAWQIAESRNASLLSAQAALAAPEGQLADARALLWNNPALSAESVRRNVPQSGLSDRTQREWNAGISQTFEIAGQQQYRRRAAMQDLSAQQLSIQEIRRQLQAEVERRFVKVLALQLRLVAERDAVRLIETAAAAVTKRVAAGEDNRLDGNVAIVEAERGRNQLAVIGEQLIDARQELANMLQLAPDNFPEVVGDLAPNVARYTLQQLVTSAAARPQLQALAQRELAARSRLDLERATRYPDVTIGLRAAREGPPEFRENIIGLNFSVPLPLFKRNASGVGKASTELAQAQIDTQSSARDTSAQVQALWVKIESLRTRVKRLEDVVLPNLDLNQTLSTKSYRAGEIGLLQLIVVNRQALDARRDLLDARAEFRLTTIALEAAAGWNNEANSK